MSKDELLFKIDQLRKDKIIYAIEACATVLICLFGFIFVNQYIHSPNKENLQIVFLVIAVSYTIFMGIGNFLRLRNIQALEKELYKKE